MWRLTTLRTPRGTIFVFFYSLDNVDFTEMLTVTKTADDDVPQSFNLPGATSGILYILVLDADSSKGNSVQDSLFVDHLFIRSQ